MRQRWIVIDDVTLDLIPERNYDNRGHATQASAVYATRKHVEAGGGACRVRRQSYSMGWRDEEIVGRRSVTGEWVNS